MLAQFGFVHPDRLECLLQEDRRLVGIVGRCLVERGRPELVDAFGLHVAFRIPVDEVIERIENKYWKVEVGNFKSWMLNIWKFTFEWTTTELEPDKILINYDYTIHGKGIVFIPFQWLFANVFYTRYMKQVLENVQKMAEGDEPFLYN